MHSEHLCTVKSYSPMGFCPAVTASNVTTFPDSAVALNAFGLTSVNLGLSSPLDLRANKNIIIKILFNRST